MLTNVPSLEWGKKNEGKAAEAFMKVEGIRHKHPKLILCGLFVFKPHPYLGATPDNIFICKCCSERYCVEYKCPFSISNEQISDSWHKTSFLEKVDGLLQLKRSHKYYTQINGQMAITGITQSYFVVWTTQGPPFIEKIYFDKSLWDKVLSNLIVFFKSFMQSCLLGINKIYTCPICDKPCLQENEFEMEAENSIECSKCLMWFHWCCCDVNTEEEFICSFCTDI